MMTELTVLRSIPKLENNTLSAVCNHLLNKHTVFLHI